MGALEELLVVQAHDTRADQLRHQRSHLPELSQAASIREEIAVIDAERAVVAGELGGIRSAEHRLEDEAATVQAKAADVERRLYDGSVTAHKELEDLQADHRSLEADLSVLAAFADGFSPPEGACGTWRALYAACRKLHDDLVEHMRLENEVLFPRFAP